jgi:transposase
MNLTSQAIQPPTIGRPKTISDAYLERLRELASHSPRQFGYPFERWTAHWLRRRLQEETSLEVSERHIHRLLKQMGLSTRHPPHSSPHRLAKIEIHDIEIPDIKMYDIRLNA